MALATRPVRTGPDWAYTPMGEVTFNLLSYCLKSQAPVTLRGVTGTVAGLEREDGSGRNWNVRLYTGREYITVHQRTVS